MNDPVLKKILAVSLILLPLGFGMRWTPVSAEESVAAGHYERVHQVFEFTGAGKQYRNAKDGMTIKRIGKGRSRFEINTIANNGHSCTMEGTAKKVTNYLEYHEVLDVDPVEPGGKSPECILKIKPSGESLVLHDVSNNCRMYYCGMRGKLDGLQFYPAQLNRKATVKK
jgi:hypothetical protein